MSEKDKKGNLRTQSQLEEIPTAVPFALARRGRISGTYTHGMQFTDAPKISMYCSNGEF